MKPRIVCTYSNELESLASGHVAYQAIFGRTRGIAVKRIVLP